MSLAAVPIAETTSDLLRLVAVPALSWAAVRDVRTRRVPGALWIPLAALAVVLLALDAHSARGAGGYVWTHDFLLPAAVSLGVVVPLSYLFWWIGGFGGADAKALLVLAVLFPTTPTYEIAGRQFPLEPSPLGSLALTVLTNAVLVGAAVPVAVAVRNALAGRFTPAMVVGRPVPVERIPETHGRLLETPAGAARSGVDLDAVRMYLRWRGLSLSRLRDDPDRFRDPATLPAEPNPPTDGAVDALEATADAPEGGAGGPPTGGARDSSNARAGDDGPDEFDDPWGAAAFLADVEGSAYGTSPADLRDGLEVLCANDRVWISPGTPFLVAILLGLAIALAYGDPLAAVLA